VFTGTMSLVGPRPEREFYINQIVEIAPHYLVLLNIKPGITSWGQIKYGYAENISEMVERLKYDMDYKEKMSVLTDLKVLIKTILVVLQASGR
jgi:lipopolysaccharide/colanic/teichoic acid biosynthesis glycosyltransferase